MSDRNRKDQGKKRADMPAAEKVQEELAKAESMDDFFGRDGIFARLFANTLDCTVSRSSKSAKPIHPKPATPAVKSLDPTVKHAAHILAPSGGTPTPISIPPLISSNPLSMV